MISPWFAIRSPGREARFMGRRILPALTLAAGCLLAVLPAGAGDWPRFRGPNGTGVSADRDVPERWSAADGILWKVPIPGAGNSSPTVSAGRVFLPSASADGSERLLLCLDAASGEQLWSRSAPGKKARMHPRNTLASGTPAADGERVYLAAWDGKNLVLLAYDYRGGLVWQRDLGPFASQFGAGHSPVVHAGRVYLADDQDGSAALLAFDAKTGKPLWHADRKAYGACYSTPFVRDTASGPELVAASTAGVTAYDPETGAANWHCEWPFARRPLRTVASPVAGAGLIFANSGNGEGSRDTIAVRPANKADGTRAEVAWQESKSFPYVPCMLVAGDYLFSVNDAGVAACHRARTGERVWSERLGSSVTASPVLIDGKVYAAGEDGQVYVFAAGPAFKLLAKNALGEPVLASPAVADGRLYLRGKEHLFCIGKHAAK
jgi:outer membrane protein assembly factor BamB